MVDSQVVKTVFKTEWLGAGVVQNMIRQYTQARSSMEALSKAPRLKGGVDLRAISNMQKFNDFNKRLMDGVRDTGLTMEQAQMASNNFGKSLGIVSEATGVLGTGLSTMTVALGAAAAGVGALILGFKALYPVLEAGSEIAQLDASFQHLNTTMTNSPNLLRDMKDASRGTLSTMAAQEGFMTLVAGSSREMTQALADAAPKILEISKAANKLNPNLGTTNFMFTSLAKGLKRAEPRLIDNLGLKLRVSDANKAMAKELNKSVMELTAEDKQMAILNETLRAGDLLIQQVGGSVDGIGDSFQRVDAATIDFKNSLKQVLALGLDISGLNDWWAETLNNQTESLLRMKDINEAYDKALISEEELYRMRRRTLIFGKGDESVEELQDLAQGRAQAQQNESDRLANLTRMYQELHDTQNELQKAGTEFVPVSELGEKMLRIRQMDATAAEKQKEASEELQKTLDAETKVARDWADAIEEASRDARDAWKEYERGLITTTAGHLEAAEEASYFTTAIADIGAGFATTGGATKEQTELIEKLEKGYEKAAEKLDDLSTGVKGFGFDEEKMAKEVEKASGAMAHFEQKLGDITVAETVTHATHQAAIWDWEKIKKALFDAADAADLSVEQYARVGVALEQVSSEQVAAGISSTAMGVQMSKALEKVRLGEIEPEDILKELEAAEAYMRNHPIEALIAPVYKAQESHAEVYDRMLEDPSTRNIPIDVEVGTDEEDLLDQWKGRMLALEEQPPEVTVKLELNEAQDAIDVFKSVNGEMWVKVHMEEWAAPTGRPVGGMGGLPEFAGGGSALANTPIIVGDQGPEVIIPGSHSTVLPDTSGAGGVNMNVNMTINGSVGVEDLTSVVEDTLLEAMQQIGII